MQLRKVIYSCLLNDLARFDSSPSLVMTSREPHAELPAVGYNHTRSSSSACRGLLVVVNPAAATAHDVSGSLAERAWRDVHTASDVEPPPVEFEVAYEQSLADGARAVQRAIQRFRCVSAMGRQAFRQIISISTVSQLVDSCA